MKSSIKYLLVIVFIGSFLGCNNPQPTALVEDDDPIELEVINKNLAEPTSFGVDSIGTSGNPARFTNVISVTGIKQTSNGILLKTSFAQAAFFDKTKPIYWREKLIGYSTITPGTVFFNSNKAEIRQFIVRYGMNRDTSLGLRYVLHRRGNLGDPFDFEYGSKVNFRFNPFVSAVVSFDIVTPPEIFLNYKLSGKNLSKNLNLILEWNAAHVKNFEILLSVIDIPLYKIKTADDGRFKLPNNLLEELAARFDKINFTLIRKYEKREEYGNSELIVLSQSINTISVELP